MCMALPWAACPLTLACMRARAATLCRGKFSSGVVVIAVKHPDGRVEFPPSGTEPFQAGDRIVLLARRGNLADFHAQYNDLA